MRLNWTNEIQGQDLCWHQQGREVFFTLKLLSWQDVGLDLLGPPWLSGEESLPESKANTGGNR